MRGCQKGPGDLLLFYQEAFAVGDDGYSWAYDCKQIEEPEADDKKSCFHTVHSTSWS